MQNSPTTTIPSDHNLLFGIIALQMQFVSQDALVKAMHEWVSRQDCGIGRILVEQSSLSGARHDMIAQLVAERARSSSQANGTSKQDGVQPPGTRDVREDAAALSWLRFRIRRFHAKGGLGEVYEAEDQELRRQVALKQIKASRADDPVSQAHFLLEAEVTGALEHPGIIPVHGLGRYPDGRPFYAMRFVRGDTFTSAIERFHADYFEAGQPRGDAAARSLVFRTLLGRFLDVCNAVAYAHSRGVLHRDLKPNNVLLGPFGETLLVDWGLALLLGRASGDSTAVETSVEPPIRPGHSPAGGSAGTPANMAPEQARGELWKIDERTDVYGLGGILYELLTASPPHPDGYRPPCIKPAREWCPWVPAALEAITARALAANPAERFAGATELADAVRQWLAEEPVAAYRETVKQLRQLVESEPSIADYQEQLARSHDNFALVLAGMQRLGEAEQECRQSLAIYQELVCRKKKTNRYRADMAAVRVHLSRILLQQGRDVEAQAEKRTAVAEYDRLMEMNPRDYRTNLASVMLTMMAAADLRNAEGPAAPARSGPDSTTAASDSGIPEPTGTVTIVPGFPAPVEAVAEQPEEMRARFTDVRRFASGGAADIFVARDSELNREVIIKEIRVDDPAIRQRFLREAQLMAQLEHPNIVPIYAVGHRSQDGRPFIVMRYVRGHDLYQAINRHFATESAEIESTHTLDELLRAFVGACRGIDYAHSRGVIHRDPKPANILMTDSGEAMVVDWGLAKVLESAEGEAPPVALSEWADPGSTHHGTVMGTPAYMAPEMLLYGAEEADVRTDVYILGATLFTVLTGKPPREGAVAEIFAAVRNESAPRRAREVNPAVSAELDAVCACAMAYSPEERYQTANALGNAVEECLMLSVRGG